MLRKEVMDFVLNVEGLRREVRERTADFVGALPAGGSRDEKEEITQYIHDLLDLHSARFESRLFKLEQSQKNFAPKI